ncbi:50S ribosomal protein L29 [Patescibacteria group bacterium]|nr:50S ribosomal protein L29 [Patescibacteria group bacterium]MBU4274932.1 50S ribosomal protein L29 [Patescibacteria group bacterium]MBU4367886.1 50S ribosomal protein L29 [Patescibacteria group bacterium]MBU4461937.1 50S ribosomal protein L29 [Patescibacteria group bacterium]MCG2699880.1 50S ribosomal protein L29 [Candidatus Parcubacteria bacterium]
MKTVDLRKKSKEELQRNIQELRESLSKLFFKLAANKLKNVKEIRNIKKDIARILTVIKEK